MPGDDDAGRSGSGRGDARRRRSTSTAQPRAAAQRRRSTLSPRGYTGPLRIKPPEPEPEPEPEAPDPFILLLGPGALVLFALAGVVAVFPLGFLTDDPQWWAVIPPGVGTVLVIIALAWTLKLRRQGALPLELPHYLGVLGGLIALLLLAAGTAFRMWWQAQ